MSEQIRTTHSVDLFDIVDVFGSGFLLEADGALRNEGIDPSNMIHWDVLRFSIDEYRGVLKVDMVVDYANCGGD